MPINARKRDSGESFDGAEVFQLIPLNPSGYVFWKKDLLFLRNLQSSQKRARYKNITR